MQLSHPTAGTGPCAWQEAAWHSAQSTGAVTVLTLVPALPRTNRSPRISHSGTQASAFSSGTRETHQLLVDTWHFNCPPLPTSTFPSNRHIQQNPLVPWSHSWAEDLPDLSEPSQGFSELGVRRKRQTCVDETVRHEAKSPGNMRRMLIGR